MNTIGYIRVSTDKQDADSQRHLLLEYAQAHKLLIDDWIEVEISSRKTTKERRNANPKVVTEQTVQAAQESKAHNI
jgi:DNA invertase Pin-like site-specific DNA recombinase